MKYFIRRNDLDVVLHNMTKVQGVSRDAAWKELNELVKDSEAEAEFFVIEEFSNKQVAKR